jgi:hypothetical protein
MELVRKSPILETMKITKKHITPLFLAAAAAIATAPIAAADPATSQSACSSAASDTICQSPGNVQINDSPGPVQFQPQYPYWEGDSYGGFARGGSHGGHR